MKKQLRFLLNEPAAAHELAAHGLKTLRARHTCAHRVDELLAICRELGIDTTPQPMPQSKLQAIATEAESAAPQFRMRDF